MPIILIRHGEAVSNTDPEVGSWHNPPLTETGRRQATILAQRLKATIDQPCVLYMSTRRRAQETAEIIGEAFGLEPIIDADLDEYRHGFDPSVTMAESKKYWVERTDPVQDWRPYSKGESFGEVFARAARVIDRIDAAGNEVSLVVTHSMLIDKIVSYWVGLTLEDMTPFVFRSSNTSITILSYRFGERIIERLNDTLHLGEYLHF